MMRPTVTNGTAWVGSSASSARYGITCASRARSYVRLSERSGFWRRLHLRPLGGWVGRYVVGVGIRKAVLMVEQLGLEVRTGLAHHLDVFEDTHEPAPESPGRADHDKKYDRDGPGPERNPTCAAGGLGAARAVTVCPAWR